MKFTFYRDRKKEWRWKLRARNGRIVADSGEGYKRRAACERAASLLSSGARMASDRFRHEQIKG